MLTGFPRTRWPRLRFSEGYAVPISVKISRICEFRVIMGIMTGLRGCCSSSTLGSRANDYFKTFATLRFLLHHSPCSLGCWTNNTLAARSLSPNRLPVAFIYVIMGEYKTQHFLLPNPANAERSIISIFPSSQPHATSFIQLSSSCCAKVYT